MFRMERVNSEIMKALLQIIGNMNDKRISDAFVSFSYVDTTPDIKFSKIGVASNSKELVKLLNNSKGYIKRELAKKIDIKTIPDLLFILDETEAKADRIEELLRQIRK